MKSRVLFFYVNPNLQVEVEVAGRFWPEKLRNINVKGFFVEILLTEN